MDFNVNTFEYEWERTDISQKEQWIRQASSLEPSEGILPVLAGLNSHHYSVRNLAREALAILTTRLQESLDTTEKDDYLAALKESVLFSGKIYHEIKAGTDLATLNFYFKILLESGGQGPYFAFKLLYKGDLSINALKKIIYTVPDSGKLAFVDQYIKTKPSIRIKYGHEFKSILMSIKTRSAVVSFFAYLFDMKRDADPFLNNLDFYLRDPAQLITRELGAKTAAERIKALKALSMVTARIPDHILLGILATEPEEIVRITVYNIIEDSSHGNYTNVFDALLESVVTKNTQEAFHAFKALVVSSNLPLYKLLENIRINRPDLLKPLIYEISMLSRISFFFIQDIAHYKDRYLKDHSDINLACILGIIKKRPERIVNIFRDYENNSQDVLRIESIDFIEKTKDLLSKEKADIQSEFNGFLNRLKKHAIPQKQLFKNVFKIGTRVPLARLFKKDKDLPSWFDKDVLSDADLSLCEFYGNPVYYNEKIIQNTSLESSVFYNAYFKKTIFYHVDMTQAKFESVCFDHAVLINVDARGAQFTACSFQGAIIFNSNFDQAKMIDASFAASVLTKNSFSGTDFSFATFSHARISAVSFVNSNLNQADFTGVKARFCRFPSSSDDIYLSDYIDYNARKFQLEVSDIPLLNAAIIEKINMLIFMEFIHYGEQKFLRQNKLSLLTAFDIFKPKQADLFEIMPLLIHENIQFPGSDSIDPATPIGITDYLPSIETQKRVARILGNDSVRVRRNPDCFIQGLFTIGSTGSLAQTIHSDIDYWVCIHENRFKPSELTLLKKKLQKLEAYAFNEFNTQITFFIVDIQRAKHNDFGDSTLESSGSAQSRILKEEFYRTMIYVAGKIPLWSVLPNSISLNYYDKILKNITVNGQATRYIDLGDIHAIPSSEYFGASIWQMFKWLKSPFKSVLKMALLEKYLFEYGKNPLLCNKYKDEWMNSGAHLRLAQNDSYIILLENLLNYFETTNDNTSKNIILTCFFLKLAISKDSDIENTVFGLRKILLKKCMDRWGWDKDKVFEIGGFKDWQYKNIARLSATIKQYMVQKYKIVNKTIDRQSQEATAISPEDRTILSRKIYIEFSKQPGKIQKILLVSRSHSYFQGLYLKYIAQNRSESHWELLNKSSQGTEEFLIHARTIEEIGAWLIINDLFTENSVINMIPNATHVTFMDIKKLFLAMYQYFHPYLTRNQSFDALLKPKTILCLFVCINFYAIRSEARVIHYTALYYNSWGEMFCENCFNSNGFESMEDFKADLKQRLNTKQLPQNSIYYFSKRLRKQ